MSKEDGVSYRSFNIVGKKQLAPLKAGYTIADMKSGICIPSSVHGYSLAVEYYRDWFLSKFDKNYFKTVFINGRHILQDYMRYSEVSMLKQAKPAVAITPIANFEHDRETQDSYMGGVDMLIGKFNHQQGFFKDYEKNIFVGMGSRELEVEFASRVRVETRAQQMDIYRHMEIACRIGYTNMEYISADFHIPYDIIKNIAVAAGFKLNKDEEVEDVVNFVKYLNAHSEMPILYKLRTMTGKSEYFVRVNRVLAHIINSDKLNKDDGEMEGQLYNNFHVEMQSTLHIYVPSYYVMYSAKPLYKYIPVADSSTFGLYSVKILEMPEINEKHWNLYIKTGLEIDMEDFKKKETEFDISSLLYNTHIRRIIDDHLKMGISPTRFIDIKIFDFDDSIEYTINWSTLKIYCKNFKSKELQIGVYIDTKYYNDAADTTFNIKRTRYKKEES